MVEHWEADRDKNSGKGIHEMLSWSDVADKTALDALSPIAGDRGVQVYQIDERRLWFWTSAEWREIRFEDGLAVPQTTHGLAVKEAVYINGSGNFIKAKSDVAATLGRGVVTKVIDADNFIVSFAGRFDAAAHGLTVGSTYYVSETVAGGLTATKPLSPNYTNPIVLVLSASQLLVLPFEPTRNASLAEDFAGTGLLSGGVVTEATSTTVDITAGTGRVVDYSDPLAPIVTEVSWSAQLGVTITGVASTDVTLFAFNASGALSQILLSGLDPGDRTSFIIVGTASHEAGAIVSVATAPQSVGYDGHTTLVNFLKEVIGPANEEGNVFSGNGANLSVNCSGGSIFSLASAFRADPTLPDSSATAPAVAPQIFSLIRAVGGASSVVHQSTAFIDPGSWDDGDGTAGAVSANDWTIQRLFRSTTGVIVAGLGQETFNNKSDAISALLTHSFAEYSPTPDLAFRAYLVVKGNATDLTNTAQAEFFEAAKFRVTGAAGAGAPSATTFLALGDTPDSYSGQAGKFAVVNDAETDMEFTSIGGGGSLILEWGWLTDIADTDPGSGNVKGNNATQGSITQLNISDVTGNGKDVSSILSSLRSGDVLIITEESNSANWIIFELNGAAVDQTTYWELPGTVPQNGFDLRNARTQAVQVITQGAGAVTEFLDTQFRVTDDGDPTKKIAFQASGITTGTTRVATMPDRDLTLGDASGPASSTDNAIARYDGTGGKQLQNSSPTIDDSGHVDLIDKDLKRVATATFDTTPESQTTASATLTVDLSARQKHKVTLAHNITTVILTAPPGIGNFLIELVQDGTGTRTIVGWPATVKWAGGVAPTFGDALNTVRIVSLYYNGTNYYGEYRAETYS